MCRLIEHVWLNKFVRKMFMSSSQKTNLNITIVKCEHDTSIGMKGNIITKPWQEKVNHTKTGVCLIINVDCTLQHNIILLLQHTKVRFVSGKEYYYQMKLAHVVITLTGVCLIINIMKLNDNISFYYYHIQISDMRSFYWRFHEYYFIGWFRNKQSSILQDRQPHYYY